MVCLIEPNPRLRPAANPINARHLRESRPHAPRRTRRRVADRNASPQKTIVRSPQDTDEHLINRLRQGDVVAGDLLVARYHRPLMRYLQWLVGADAAEDLHQQTWLSVLDHLDNFNTESTAGGFKAWVFRIASNKAKDRWRSRGRERDAKANLGMICSETAPDTTGKGLETTEQCEKLREAMESLPEGQRQVLVLRYYSNLKFVDIADMLGCPLNTALTRAHKGLTKLRNLMHCA